MRSRQSICIIEQEAEAAGPVVANCEEAGRHTATSSQLHVQRQAIASKYQTNGRTAESASVHQRRGGKACAVGGEEGYKLEGVFPIISSVNKFSSCSFAVVFFQKKRLKGTSLAHYQMKMMKMILNYLISCLTQARRFFSQSVM